ncbi:MAG: ribosomal protein S18-alanine N-acetyltransferase [Aridibacter famidurans]|nr:ribosomal protein S18-alanine N-acetyltransferase [Aridibacter famidurans]
MAIVQRIRDLFVPAEPEPAEEIVPAPQTAYSVRTMTESHLREVMLLNLRCFRRGENYTKYTFKYLLTDPSILSYRAVTPDDRMVGFIFVLGTNETIAHITTIGVAPEHRKRGIARMLLEHAEAGLSKKGFDSIVLEVRVSNRAAIELYSSAGYVVMQRLSRYYNNGEDAFLMSKVVR